MRFLLIIYACLSLGSHAVAQDLKDYRQQQRMLTDHIDMLDKSLKGKQSKKKSITDDYRLLSQKIEKRSELQSNISHQIADIDSLITTTDQYLSDMYVQQAVLQEQSDELLRQDYYRRKGQNAWLHILSARSLESMLIRWRRSVQLRDHLDQKVAQIQHMRSAIGDTISHLAAVRGEKENLLIAEEENLYQLQQEQLLSDQTLKKLTAEESVIRAELSKQKKENDRLAGVIRELIKSEVAKSPTTSAGRSSWSTASRGRMPWPVDGVVTSHFGVTRHPTLANVKTENHGIDMLCSRGARIQAVADGEVLIVTRQPPYDHVVIVSHGDYTTAYFYLTGVTVAKGDRVVQGQRIGSLSTEGDGQTFHFEVWHRQRQVDPEKWLRAR